jgi:hypothetical protein
MNPRGGTVRLTVDQHAAQDEGRTAALHTAVAVLRLIEGYQEFLGPDLDRLMIVLAVGAITAERPVKAADAPDYFSRFGTPLPSAEMTRCTALSIAAATGLPRETARRKTMALIHDGVLRRDEKVGIRVNEVLVQRPDFQKLTERQAGEIARLANALIDCGVLVRS